MTSPAMQTSVTFTYKEVQFALHVVNQAIGYTQDFDTHTIERLTPLLTVLPDIKELFDKTEAQCEHLKIDYRIARNFLKSSIDQLFGISSSSGISPYVYSSFSLNRDLLTYLDPANIHNYKLERLVSEFLTGQRKECLTATPGYEDKFLRFEELKRTLEQTLQFSDRSVFSFGLMDPKDNIVATFNEALELTKRFSFRDKAFDVAQAYVSSLGAFSTEVGECDIYETYKEKFQKSAIQSGINPYAYSGYLSINELLSPALIKQIILDLKKESFFGYKNLLSDSQRHEVENLFSEELKYSDTNKVNEIILKLKEIITLMPEDSIYIEVFEEYLQALLKNNLKVKLNTIYRKYFELSTEGEEDQDEILQYY